MKKIQEVGDAEDFETFVNTILENAHTGSSGDGPIFVSDVKEAMKIRTKKRSKKLLDCKGLGGEKHPIERKITRNCVIQRVVS